MAISLAQLTEMAAQADEPSLVSKCAISPGGVDPLGLRQINFDLMDQVFPGLNNVARHIRPFVVTTWAWRRAKQLAENEHYDRIQIEKLRDFVDRIEVIYTWSQFLRDTNADLPGRQVLTKLVESESWTFGGEAWLKRRKDRRYSTAFSAPITYGPGLKTFGWLATHRENSDVLIPLPESAPALDAFEQEIADELHHPAFSHLGEVSVNATDVLRWAEKWALDRPTEAEKSVMADMLMGMKAPMLRQNGCSLTLAAAGHVGTSEPSDIRVAMSGTPSNFRPDDKLVPAALAWRRVQVRQLFRLSLEALLTWIIRRLNDDGPQSSTELVAAFLASSSRNRHLLAADWLTRPEVDALSPPALLTRIQDRLKTDGLEGLPDAISDGLAFSIAQAPESSEPFERHDRLPLARARREAMAWREVELEEFLRHLFESWALAQHLYWAVGRGLADARSRGKRIFRLRVVLDENGWSLTPGTSVNTRPAPSEDRLRTAVTLAKECGLL